MSYRGGAWGASCDKSWCPWRTWRTYAAADEARRRLRRHMRLHRFADVLISLGRR